MKRINTILKILRYLPNNKVFMEWKYFFFNVHSKSWAKQDTQHRCWIATSPEPGSVAIFKIKKSAKQNLNRLTSPPEHTRVLVTFPSPHVTEQLVQDDHRPHEGQFWPLQLITWILGPEHAAWKCLKEKVKEWNRKKTSIHCHSVSTTSASSRSH